MISLVSTFLDSEGHYHNLTVKEPDTTKSADEIKESLELLTSLNLFEKDGVGLFQKVVKAKFVEKIETPIFKGSKLFGEPMPPQPATTLAVMALPEPSPMFFRSQSQTALNQHLQTEETEPKHQPELPSLATTEAKHEATAPAVTFYTRVKEKLSWRTHRKNRAKGREAPT